MFAVVAGRDGGGAAKPISEVERRNPWRAQALQLRAPVALANARDSVLAPGKFASLNRERERSAARFAMSSDPIPL